MDDGDRKTSDLGRRMRVETSSKQKKCTGIDKRKVGWLICIVDVDSIPTIHTNEDV